MSIFKNTENFPFTIERENGKITPLLESELLLSFNVCKKLENIFNDNARIKL